MAARDPAPRISPLVATNLGIVYLGWGSTYLAIRVMVRTIPPLLGAGLRFSVAGLVVLAIVRLRAGRDAVRVSRNGLASAALIGVLLPAGGNGLVTLAERSVPSGIAALIVALVPVWVVLAGLVLGERPAPLALAGVILGFAGVAVLLLPGGGTGHAGKLGMLAVVIAALSWAIGSVASGRLPLPANAWTATGIEMLAGGVVMLASGLAVGESGRLQLADVSTSSLEGLVYLTVIGSIVTFSAYVWLLKHAPLPLVSTYAFVNPLVAVLLGTLLLSERLTPAIAAGASAIVAAVALITASRRREPEARPAPSTS